MSEVIQLSTVVSPKSAMHRLKDCTWCKHRVSYTKAIERKYELEKCALTQKTIAPPSQSLLRRCDRFQLKNCSCSKCNI